MRNSSKKRGSKKRGAAYLITQEYATTLLKRMSSGFRYLHRNVRDRLRTTQEPYCEISQTPEGMLIAMNLPQVKEKNIVLQVFPRKLNVTGRKSNFLFIKNVELSSQADVENMRVKFRNDRLKITIPYLHPSE